jgi:hypothetical protein
VWQRQTLVASCSDAIFAPTCGIGHLTDPHATFSARRCVVRRWTGAARHRSCMSCFDNWWERIAVLARVAPVFVSVMALFMMPMGHYWE